MIKRATIIGHAATATALVIAGAFLFGLVPRVFAASGFPDPSSCHLKAFVTADNDIRLANDDRPAGKPVPMPAAVADKIHAAAKRLSRRVSAEVKEGLTCGELFPATYRISLSGQRELYVSEISIYAYLNYFYLILYDPATGAVTQHPVAIDTHWTKSFGAKDELVKRPFVSSADLYENHHSQIVFEVRVHNGNMYNAVVYLYFAVGPDLSLRQVLARETRLIWNDGDHLIVRELTALSPSRLRLDNFNVARDGSPQRTELGYVILESRRPEQPFHVVRRHPVDRAKFDCLVTCMDEAPGDDVFLRQGDPINY